MKIERDENISLSFVLTADQIERIAKRFDDSDHLSFRAQCVDEISREFSTTAELLQYENTPNKAIEYLSMFVISKNLEEKALIRFSTSTIENVRIKLRGEEKDVLDLMEFLHERLHAIKSWYDFFERHKSSGLLINLVVNYALAVPITIAIFKQIKISPNPLVPSWAIVVAVIVILNVAVNLFWARVLKLYFPMGVFAINQGLKRHNDKEIIRTVVIAGSLISLFTSIYVLFIS